MIVYCDASLVISALADERHSEFARSFLETRDLRDMVVSGWVATEVASAAARKQRRNDIEAGERAALLAKWSRLRSLVSETTVASDHFELAAALVDAGSRGLRAGDALHLAIAKRARLALATLDRDLADAAEAVGVEVALRPPA